MKRMKQRGFLLNPFRFTGTPTEDAYRDLMLSLAPLAYWRLDETSGTACVDSSGNGINASYFADASTITSPGLLSGSDNRGLDLPLQAINIKAGFDRPLPLAIDQPWSMVALIMPMGETSAGASCLMQLGTVSDSSSNVPEIGPSYPGGGKFSLRVMRSGVAQLFESPAYDFGTRLHVVLTHGGGSINLWINGAKTNTLSHSFGGSPGNAKFGHAVFSGSNYYPLYGKLDEVALFSSVLTDAQIAALYAAS